MSDDIETLVAERLAAIDQVYLKTQGVKKARELIRLTRTVRRRGKACCSLIWGPSGVGKSCILDAYEADEPEALPGTKPVLRVDVPSPFSQAAFARAFLRAMGKFVAPRQDLDVVLDRIIRYLAELKVELILLDEVSHVVDHRKRNGSIPYWVTDTIKLRFLEQACVPVVMTGIPVARELFEMNPQLLTRRVECMELAAYDAGSKADFGQMLLLLGKYERAAKFGTFRFPDDHALARRLHAATLGINGRIAMLTKRAAEMATRRGLDGLDQDILAQACAALADPDKGWKNPFLGDMPAKQEKADESRVTALHKGKAA